MSDDFDYELDEDDEIDLKDFELFDISDITYDMFTSKNRKKFSITAVSERDFNLMRIYLWLKATTERLEQELGIMEELPEIQ